MGTIFEPTKREWLNVIEFEKEILKIKSLAGEYNSNLSFSEIIETLKYLEMKRANDLYKSNGDIFDEQMMGLAKILTTLNENIKSLSTAIEGKQK